MVVHTAFSSKFPGDAHGHLPPAASAWACAFGAGELPAGGFVEVRSRLPPPPSALLQPPVQQKVGSLPPVQCEEAGGAWPVPLQMPPIVSPLPAA